ncbi:MAG TPA: crosslink repair DNA glycosylase YcaQ family protein [Bacteroidia bacterium]|nr:crosslink repair DNA glycosylase YcaQ family protein [Bacteroidia bacterium]
MKTQDHKISKEHAKNIALRAQGLTSGPSFGSGKSGALKTIKHLGYLQLDTLAVVARAHHHTLYTRTPAYKETHLDELLKERSIFEYWAHAASYLPMEDYRFTFPRKDEFLSGRSHWFKKDKKVMKYVLDRIKNEGPLQAKDFESEKQHGSWSDWKPAKIALGNLFMEGSLMISERKGFNKVYDLTERVLPTGVDITKPTLEEYAEYLIKSTLRAHSFATAKEIAYLRKGMLPHVQQKLKQLVQQNILIELQIENVQEKQYAFPEILKKTYKNKAAHVSLLSPFDNAVIMRNRLKQIFDFDYGVECYLPEHERKFGYFCLPILYGNDFIGRLDPKADKQKKEFIIRSLHIENKPIDMDNFLASLSVAIKQFAVFHGCTKIVIEKTYPAKIKASLKNILSNS